MTRSPDDTATSDQPRDLRELAVEGASIVLLILTRAQRRR